MAWVQGKEGVLAAFLSSFVTRCGDLPEHPEQRGRVNFHREVDGVDAFILLPLKSTRYRGQHNDRHACLAEGGGYDHREVRRGADQDGTLAGRFVRPSVAHVKSPGTFNTTVQCRSEPVVIDRLIQHADSGKQIRFTH